MRTKVIEFIRRSVSNQKRVVAKYDNIMENFSEATGALYAREHARAAETLELWEAMLTMVTSSDKDILAPIVLERGHGTDKYNLSKRELEILRHVAEGEPNKVIAYKTHFSEATVKIIIRAILRKMKLTNRTKLAIRVREEGLV